MPFVAWIKLTVSHCQQKLLMSTIVDFFWLLRKNQFLFLNLGLFLEFWLPLFMIIFYSLARDTGKQRCRKARPGYKIMNFLQDFPEVLPSPQPEKHVSCSDILKGHTLCLSHLSPCNKFLLDSLQVSRVHSQGWQDRRVHWPSGTFQPVLVLSYPCSYVFIFETTAFSILVAQTTSPEWPRWKRWEAPFILNSFVITWRLEMLV